MNSSYMKNRCYLLFLPLLLGLGCDNSKDIYIRNDISLFAFIVSENDLDDITPYIEYDLAMGLKGCPVGTEMFLYIDRLNACPTLRHFFIEGSGEIAVRTITNYPEQCSTSKEVFQAVLQKMLDNSSGQRYGLIYWSHGSGWLPAFKGHALMTRSLGEDNGVSMDVEDMADVIANLKKADFIMMDACFMGGVETAYAMHEATDYLIASPTQIMGIGFPYAKMLPLMMKGTVSSYSKALSAYLDAANSDLADGLDSPSAIASLVDCSKIDALASAFRQIVMHCDTSKTLNIDSIQPYDSYNRHVYYDLGQFAFLIATSEDDYEMFTRQLGKTVVFKVSTPTIFTQSNGRDSLLKILTSSGLSTYIPFSGNLYYDLEYSKTAWYKTCYQ